MSENKPYKIYLNSSKPINTFFSKESNCQSQFNNLNSVFRIKIPQSVHIDPSNVIQRQKQIQNVVRVPSSIYTMNLGSLYVGNNIGGSNLVRGKYNASDRLNPHGKGKNIGVDIKHNSYDRYLARKKSQYLKTEQKNNSFVPKYGNKTMKFGLVNSTTCNNC